MRVTRWTTAAGLALVLAVLPGALHRHPDPAPAPERAPVLYQRVAPRPTEVAVELPAVLEGEVAAPTAPAPTFTAETAPASDEVFALLIGIDDYPGRRADLRSAVADVDTMDAAMAGFGVPAGHRVVLRDGQATRPEVEAAVKSLVLQGGPGATYVLGYAGHARKLDRDTEALVLADGGLLRDVELAALLAPATTQRMWLLLSACYSGGFTELLAPGRVLTAAASATELAWEDPALNGSYLVHYLIRQGWLQGKAGDSVQEAFAYADMTMARERPLRRPVQIDQAGSALVLGLGDPTSALGLAPPVPPPAPPRPSTPAPPSAPPPTTTTTRPPDEDGEPLCLLGVLSC